MAAIAVILGSAYTLPPELPLTPVLVDTPFGLHTLHRIDVPGREAWVSFRHGMPHARLPHQVNYRAQAAALGQVGCGALLITSSVGVLDPNLPVFAPLLVEDLLMLDNRLPDGSACTVFPQRTHDQGHLVYDEGPFSAELDAQVERLAARSGAPVAGRAVFGWQVGPRVNTRAERRMWERLGAQVESMTVAPEVVLANELAIPCSAIAVGHKRSNPDAPLLLDSSEVTANLERTRQAMEALIVAFLHEAQPVAPRNHLYRFEGRGPA